MPPPQTAPQNAKAMRLIQLGLTLGLSLMAAVFFILRRLGQVPAIEIPRVAGIALTVASISTLVVALTVVRPRVQPQAPEQTADMYWGDATVRVTVVMLWAGVEGAGLMGALGYLLTGALAPGIALVMAILTLASMRPSRFERDEG